jgi:hypothetical protein
MIKVHASLKNCKPHRNSRILSSPKKPGLKKLKKLLSEWDIFEKPRC